MITKFKIFENKSKIPKVGDYVVCKLNKKTLNNDIFSKELDKEVENFLSNNIGKIKKIKKDILKKVNIYKIKYDDRQVKFKKSWNKYDPFYGKIIDVKLDDIVFFSSKKEVVEAYISSKKYNL
jgi:hypothetical protein